MESSVALMPPVGRKNLRPLRSEGWWDAVTITEASARKPSVSRLIYMAGVVHMPKSHTLAPARAMPSAQAASSSGPVMRESRPMATVNWGACLPVFSLSQVMNAPPMHRATSFVSTAFSPMATPRTSVPLFKD